ncbi:MAG: SDR family NAD(P)-dependent oxidoreductase [bacterium]|nr:SDR family NAD(P)-dependent oxidoreductase [bacterium]
MDFSGKTVVITGGATGIGFAVAKVLGADGSRIVIAEPRREKLDEAAEALAGLGVDCCAVECDVTDLAQVEALADAAWERFGRVDVVMNNAGISIPASTVVEGSLDDVRAVFEVNFFGVWHGCRVFGRRFLDQDGEAAIYNTGSENSLFLASSSIAAYAATKHAVFALTEGLREQMPDRIHVGLILPGFVRSEMSAGIGHLGMDTDVYAAKVVEQMRNDEELVVSHPYHMVHVRDRYDRLSRAFAEYAPRYEGDDEHDCRTLFS